MVVRCLSGIFLLMLGNFAMAQDHGLKVPPGFKVTLFADEKLANDIYCMTLDAKGDVYVSSKGWIKRLVDSNGDGVADKAEIVIKTATGAMGMCFVGDDLYYAADHGVLVSHNLGKDISYQWTSRIVSLKFGEHGVHAIRRGPDDWLYIIGGNDAGLDQVELSPSSPIQKPEGGGILRIKNHRIECIAHGFRNPYDFDFTPRGDIITYDSDTERDFLLPWYSPTRLYHVGWGQHHGWRLPGYMRSLARRDYYLDTVDILAPIGRGSPTGVACYRHTQFPEHYRGGVFALDWTFGKVYYCPLKPDGATYRTTPEVFIEPTGSNGFAPTDVCVAKDGSLLISIGGRGTRGAVYRVEYVGNSKQPRFPRIQADEWIDHLMEAPQPLEPWSPYSQDECMQFVTEKELGPAIVNPNLSEEYRARAVDWMAPNYTSQLERLQAHFSESSSPWVRRAVARSYEFPAGFLDSDAIFHVYFKSLLTMLTDPDPAVRVQAMQSVYCRWEAIHYSEQSDEGRRRIRDALVANFAHSDKRVRQAAVLVASKLSRTEWANLRQRISESGIARHTYILAELKTPQVLKGDMHESIAATLAKLLEESTSPKEQLELLRLIMLCYGDWNLHAPPAEVYSAYSLPPSINKRYWMQGSVSRLIRSKFPSPDPLVHHEASRLLAMLQDEDPKAVTEVVNQFRADSAGTDDVHFLIVLSRLKGPRTAEQTKVVAEALLGLDAKLQGKQSRIKQNWAARLGEVVTALLQQHPDLANELLAHPDFPNSGNVSLTTSMTPKHRAIAAARFLDVVVRDPNYSWSPELVELLGVGKAEKVRPVLRKQWSDFTLREAILRQLAQQPVEADRAKFLVGVESPNREVAKLCIEALLALPKDEVPQNWVPILKALRTALAEPKAQEWSEKVLTLFNRQSGQKYDFANASKAFAWFEKTHPEAAKGLLADDEIPPAELTKLMAAVPWEKGNADRGLKLYQSRSCAACHSGGSRIGPDLTGVTGRFSREALFTSIVAPHRDVAPAFRVNDIQLQNGKRLSGIVVFESADGVILQTDATTTLRIATEDMAVRKQSTKSLMPTGLLKDLKPEDWADLFMYLHQPLLKQ